MVAAEIDRPHVVAHAVLRHHPAADIGRALQVAARAGGHLPHDERFGRIAAQRHRHKVQKLRAGGEIALLVRQQQRVAAAPAARHDRHQMHVVAAAQQLADNCVTRFVAGDKALVLVADDMALLFRPHLHALNRVVQVAHGDLLLALARAENRGLVHNVFQIRAREIRRALGDVRQIDVIRQRLLLRVDAQNRLAAAHVGVADGDLPVKPAGTQQRRVENILAVRRRQHDHALVHREAIHLDETLVERRPCPRRACGPPRRFRR